MTTALHIPEALQARLTQLSFLMPSSGPAETLEGELIRAINKVAYRYYNDGDYWYCGYGTETAGGAAAYLADHSLHGLNLLVELDNSDGAVGHAYERALFALIEKVVAYCEDPETEWVENEGHDMLRYDSKYEDEDEGDCYDDEDEDEDEYED